MNKATNKAVSYILARLREPSTWAGVALFLGFFGVSPETVERVTSNGVAVVTALAAVAAIIVPDLVKGKAETLPEDPR